MNEQVTPAEVGRVFIKNEGFRLLVKKFDLAI